ncbi:MAG: metallophosphoesterase [Oscillospiraceae bacterium]|jgi:tetrahydromethanopterin S-methyltransferase subunit G/predicted phosphodiesterase|nr:metallophosphoesterase [Oscillospiraceae bacterium]
MIYVTGDTHGDLSRFKHPAFRKIKKRDALIICGDFGFIWDGGKKEKRALKWLGKRRYDVLFVDGAHENFDELEKYGEEYWCGGKTRKISGKLRLLMRGQVFEIGGKRVLAFGGGYRDESERPAVGRENNDSDEKPSPKDYEEAMRALEKADFKVDYVVSYEPPTRIAEFLSLNRPDVDKANRYLDDINEKTEYKRWFFGRHHVNKIITSKYFALFDNVVAADYNLLK